MICLEWLNNKIPPNVQLFTYLQISVHSTSETHHDSTEKQFKQQKTHQARRQRMMESKAYLHPSLGDNVPILNHLAPCGHQKVSPQWV
jgi:uncharacterized sporulation protein YeaH/YhbH (DUF444 family)